MITIGNDIVDFSAADNQNKYQDQRFLQRVFSDTEIAAITQAENKAKILWALWAAKEAAFKAWQKRDLNLVFAPKRFQVCQSSLQQLIKHNSNKPLTATLHHQYHNLTLQWQWPEPYCVHCCAVLTDKNQDFSQWQQLQQQIKKIVANNEKLPTYAKQSLAARELLIKHLEPLFDSNETLSVARPQITKNGVVRKGPPALLQGLFLRDDYDISLSHDGYWAAVCWLKKLQ